MGDRLSYLLCVFSCCMGLLYAAPSVYAETNDLSIKSVVEQARQQQQAKKRKNVRASLRKKEWYDVAHTTLETAEGALQGLSIVGGVIILCSSLFMFNQYRKNQTQVRLSSIWLTVGFGCVLLFVPYLGKPGKSQSSLNRNINVKVDLID